MSATPHYVPSPTPDLARIERALISVSDKEGLVELGKALAATRHRNPVDRRLGQGACATPD